MKIANSVQIHLQNALKAANSMEPITFCGMYECGASFIFGLLPPLLTSELEKGITTLYADLSSNSEKTLEELLFAVKSVDPKQEVSPDYVSLTAAVKDLAQKQKVVFVFYLGQEGKIDPGLLPFLNRLRIFLGWKFSYCLFLTTRFLFQSPSADIMDDLIRQTAVPVLPRTPEDTRIVIGNYEDRWKKKITNAQQELIVTLSGGNPGLIKALFLQAVENPIWHTPNMLDEHLFYRLQGIAADLPERYIQVLLHGKKEKCDDLIENLLLRYGYLKQEGKRTIPFSNLFVPFIETYAGKTIPPPKKKEFMSDQVLLQLTKSQRTVFSYLREHPGEIIPRDTIANLLWGDDWADKYSDWAIDQLFSTLREKLLTIRHSGKIITKKGEGLIYLPK